MSDLKTPGVYVEEIPGLPPSIASVDTAIPAFIGYTEKAHLKNTDDLLGVPHKISSMPEYISCYGEAFPEESIEINIDRSNPLKIKITGTINETTRSKYLMYYSLQMFFINGGGQCYIVSVDKYPAAISLNPLLEGLNKVNKIDEVTLLLCPDGFGLTADEYYALQNESLAQSALLKNRFALMDTWLPATPDPVFKPIEVFREKITADLDKRKYGAAYYPRVYSVLDYKYNDEAIKINGGPVNNLHDLKTADNALYFQVKAVVNSIELLLPASPAIAGIYAAVDNNRGVWKAPANVNINSVSKPEIILTNKEQDDLNVDSNTGKSINAIRSFPGHGPSVIWGARTLAGNDNEWRYISVRRFFNMVEASVKNGTLQFVFEPNDKNTWVRVKAMIQNYLAQQWRAGALFGSSTKEAFFVQVGLGETMTEQDILEGRMIIKIGMAVTHPAEFIILQFIHKMLAAL
jgi:hypothetical protein